MGWIRVFRHIPTDHSGNSEKTAVRILQERYARGEIDEEEYQSRLRHLRE
ncbi:SHOCT domain-containing protein [Alicyclobacillus sp. ALC3]